MTVIDASRMTRFEVLPLSFWRRPRNHLVEFDVNPASDEIAEAGFAAQHGGGVILLINRQLAAHMIDQISSPAPFLITFYAEIGGNSTLVVDEDMRAKMLRELLAFLGDIVRIAN